ncbi:hypothetical protein D3C72_1877280 [compost metagenome]
MLAVLGHQALQARLVTLDFLIVGIDVDIDAFPDAFMPGQQRHGRADVAHCSLSDLIVDAV